MFARFCLVTGDKEGGNVEFKRLWWKRVTARTVVELTLFRGNGTARRSPFLSSRGIVVLYNVWFSGSRLGKQRAGARVTCRRYRTGIGPETIET